MTDESRFEFGSNWEKYLHVIDEERIISAEQSLLKSLKATSIKNKKFLDIGSGSGLFSLAAHRLGAEVVSIDYDQNSVMCTSKLKEKYAKDSSTWKISQGSALDKTLMESLGKFDIVYSWGVLHHTGDMKTAIDLASKCVNEKGKFFIAIYNDQGGSSKRWLTAKKLYNKLPPAIRSPYVFIIAAWHETQYALKRLLRGQNPIPKLSPAQNDRGMTIWIDWIDWVGGLPFEVASPEQIILPLRDDGFVLDFLKTEGKGWGCNEYVFHLNRDALQATEEAYN